MPLRTRVILLVIAAVAILCMAFTLALWQRDAQLTERYHTSLLQGQNIAWEKLRDQHLRSLHTLAATFSQKPEWLSAWKKRDYRALSEQLNALRRNDPDLRVDVFDAQQKIIDSTESEIDPVPMLNTHTLAKLVSGERSSQLALGLVHVARGKYYLVDAQSFGDAQYGIGILVFSMDASKILSELSSTIGGDLFIINLRGRVVAGVSPYPRFLDLQNLDARTQAVKIISAPEQRTAMLVIQPLQNIDRRTIGALVSLHDVTAALAQDKKFNTILLSVGGLVIAIFAIALYWYLYYAMEPLKRAVNVLEALARSDLETCLDEGDEEQDDEAGKIARGIAALRVEMLNFQMLRDERMRIRQQQERLIREQLRALAENLDAESRSEILFSLEGEGDAIADSDNQLARLAGILGRMSGLVTDQQVRLLKLLKELQTAMKSQALLVSLQQEIEIARNIQLSILPRDPPRTEQVDIVATMISARDIGGDFYDYFLLDENHLAVVVADVSGKGVPAAFFMAISRTLLKANTQFLRDPAEIITKLNSQLCSENEQMMFVTLFFAVLDLRSGILRYVNAGHNPPVFLPSGQAPGFLPYGNNMALAINDHLTYVAGSLTLLPGDQLFLYTDGVTEASNPRGQLFGAERLLQSLNSSIPLADLPANIVAAIHDFEEGSAQFDDITCVALRYRG